jgi:protein-L-isoaspartate(D-aspartate) O-methyltransferase
VPPKIAEQLAPGGVLVLPMGPEREGQRLMRLERRAEGGWHADDMGPVRFVPLIAGALPRMETPAPPATLPAVEEA